MAGVQIEKRARSTVALKYHLQEVIEAGVGYKDRYIIALLVLEESAHLQTSRPVPHPSQLVVA